MDASQEIGLVDLETLIKIHEQLVQSHYENDNELACYIRENYLPEGFNDDTKGGVQIQGAESFTNLYNAYKRVRNLTGRVQDKWPFFDRKWKAINKNDVIKIAAGEDNATLPEASSNSLKSSSENSGTGKSPPTNGSQAAQSTSQHLPSSSYEAATDQPEVIVHNEGEPAQEPPLHEIPGTLSPSPSAVVVPSSMTPTQSSKSGNLENDTSPGSSLGSVLAAAAPSERSSLDNLPMKRKLSPDSDISGHRTGGNRGMNKRQRGASKAVRGSGGVKKSSRVERAGLNDDEIDHTPPTFDGLTPHHEVNPQTDTTHTNKSAPAQKLRATPPSPRITRQKKRISKGSDTHTPARRDSLASATSQNLSTRKPRAGSDTIAMPGKTTSATTNDAISNPDTESTAPDLTDANLINLGMSHFGSREQPSTTKPVKTDGSANNAQTPETDLKVAKKEAGTVEIFARVSTQNGVHDILLPSTIIDDKGLEKTLLGYAAWKEKMGDKKAVDFETWRSINGFDW